MKNKITTSKVLLAVMLMFGIMFTSCEKNEGVDEPIINNEEDTESVLDFGATIQRDFMGRIVDASSSPLDNVNITIGNKTAITDANGVFIISNASVKEKQAFITAEKPGFFKGMRSVVPTQGANSIRIMLIAENLAGTVASGIPSDVTLSNGAKVSFDGNFKDDNGNAYTGNVDVYMYHLETSNPAIDDVMPGNLLAQNANEEERVLVSLGMLNVELRGDSGQELNIADGSVAQIELPINPAQSSVAPSTIPLWHFDEVAGHWIEDGQATLVGNKYIGDVPHFSWWNWDAPFPAIVLCVNVKDASNIALSNVKIELVENNFNSGRFDYTNGSGQICGYVPLNETLTLNAYDSCGTLIHSTNIGPFSVDTDYDVVLSSITAAVISGNLVNCTNTNVTNGYASIIYGNEFASAPVTNGSFSFGTIPCASLTGFSLEGVDYDTFQTTTVIPYNIANSNIGNIIACNTVTEFITIQVDNEPIQYFLSNIIANSFNVNSNSISADNDNGDTVLIGGTTTALGTYPFSGTPYIGIELNNLNIPSSSTTIQTTITNFGTAGQYMDMTMSGTYVDFVSGNTRTLLVSVHVIRDN
ncbi:carboxypeptidase-like regulatory domain-containing protein [Lacinutrix algicola]|uniref:carboxypeptidase-like regulatory domain-containing protein n=1 Tax=Lacinutrix algicola TaxID=342954 RepID=UPI0006E2C96B|nr:carboxypeptidase-like regulatory domain-containing protein [Lacinutrix algicola]